MKRKTLLHTHLLATFIAVTTIAGFFASSLIAEMAGSDAGIKKVKAAILYCLPVLIITMPILAITGKKLAGRSRSIAVVKKQKRMKLIAINGMVLISLACLLHYRSQHQGIDRTFLFLQVLELVMGLTNLVLIGQNIKDGLQLSGKLKKKPECQANLT